MKFKYLVKASLTKIVTIVLILFTLITFPSRVLAQTDFACMEFDATAVQCLEDAIKLKNDGGNLDDVKFFLNRAIDKVNVFALVAAKSRLAELKEEQGNTSEADQLIEEAIAIGKAVGITASCPSCGACGSCPSIRGRQRQKTVFGCNVCPRP